jgi:glutathione-independent formaldehyde dehydrogenase
MTTIPAERSADRAPERLDEAREIGVIAIDLSRDEPVQQIEGLAEGEGTDRGIDAVGYQAVGRSGEREDPATVLNQLVQTVRPTGSLGVPGLYVPTDPGGIDEHAKQGMLLVAIGTLFEKGLRLGTGRANVKRYNRQLRDLITQGRARPGFVVSHELPLDEAPSAYQKFDKRIDGYTKVILKPFVERSQEVQRRKEMQWRVRQQLSG